MRTLVMGVVLSAAIISAGCGATRKVTSTVAPGPAITGAPIQFIDRDHAKDMALPMSGTFSRTDLGDGQIRIRLTPDGRDDWSFEPHLMLTFSDGTSRTYAWPQVMLDNARPEVTLILSSAVQNP
jgi:hypothetical protein